MRDRWAHVPYPAWWQEKAALRRSALDDAVARVRERLSLVSGIRGALVFGSYATGNVGPTSDLDLIVVIDDDGSLWSERWARVRAALDLDIQCDLIVYGPEQYERMKATRNFVAQAAAQGIWIDAAASR